MAENKEDATITDEQTAEQTTIETEEVVEENESVEENVSESASLEAQLAEAKDKYLRLYADFENFRRRTSKEKIDLIQNAAEGLLKELIPIVDDSRTCQ